MALTIRDSTNNPPFSARLIRRVGYGALCLWLCFRWCLTFGGRLLSDPLRGEDFAVFRASALALLHGTDPYSLPPGIFPNRNHPLVTLWSVPYALLSADLGYAAWLITALAAYLLALALAVRVVGLPRGLWAHPLTITIALTYAGLAAALFEGQISPFLAPLLVVAWGAARRDRFMLAAVLLGALIALKVTLLPLAALILARRSWREIGALGGGAAAVSLICLPFVGVSGYLHWFALLGAVDYASLNTTNMSLTGWLYHFVPDAPRFFANLGIAAACVAGLLVARAAPPRGWHPADWHIGVLVLLGLLSSPISWDHYGPFLIPVAAASLATWPRLLPVNRLALAAGALCVLCALDIRLLGFLFWDAAPLLGTILCGGLVLVLLALLMRRRDAKAVPELAINRLDR